MTTGATTRQAALPSSPGGRKGNHPGCQLDLLFLQALANGHNHERASALVARSAKTMNNRMLALRARWGCHNTLHAVAKALREGKIE